MSTPLHQTILLAIRNDSNFKETPAAVEAVARKYCEQMETLVGEDIGKRGIANFVQKNILYDAADRMLYKRFNMLICTGYPCLMKYDPPTESDGLAGAFSMANTFLNLNKGVGIVTDVINGDPVRKSIEYIIKRRLLEHPHQRIADDLTLHVFGPDLASPTSADAGTDRFESLLNGYHALVAIERSGKAEDGHYYTMRGIDMSDIMAPIDQLFERALEGQPKRPTFSPLSPSTSYTPAADYFTLGIGDGGNEVGMGNYREQVKKHIPLGEKIGSIVKCHKSLVCGVSNWGGYAVSAAVAVRVFVILCKSDPAAIKEAVKDAKIEQMIDELVSLLLPNEESELQYARYLITIGVRDGVTGELSETVDGLPFEVTNNIVRKLRTITKECCLEIAKAL